MEQAEDILETRHNEQIRLELQLYSEPEKDPNLDIRYNGDYL